MSKVAQTASSHSQHQVVFRRGCRHRIMFTRHNVQTIAAESVYPSSLSDIRVHDKYVSISIVQTFQSLSLLIRNLLGMMIGLGALNIFSWCVLGSAILSNAVICRSSSPHWFTSPSLFLVLLPFVLHIHTT